MEKELLLRIRGWLDDIQMGCMDTDEVHSQASVFSDEIDLLPNTQPTPESKELLERSERLIDLTFYQSSDGEFKEWQFAEDAIKFIKDCRTFIENGQPQWRDIEHQPDKIDETKAPFDGKPVLVKTNTGIVEAWWCKAEITRDHEGIEDCTGFEWVCYDDKFTLELDEAKSWQPLPAIPNTVQKQGEV